MEKIKPCPFCKENNPIMRQDRKVHIITTYYVQCCNCNCRTGYCPTQEDAVERWNRRVDNE